MGRDKAALVWGGGTMLEAVADVVLGATRECVLLGDVATVPGRLKGVRRLPDVFAGVGPIGGLHSLLSAFPEDWCLLVSCDVPGVSVETIARLAERMTDEARVVVYGVEAEDGTHMRFEPCCALYHASIVGEVEVAIAAGRCSLNRLIATLPHAAVAVDGSVRRSLRNINTPEDYDAMGGPVD